MYPFLKKNLDATAFQILLPKPRLEHLNIRPGEQQPFKFILKMDHTAPQISMKKLVQRPFNLGDFVCRQLQAIFDVSCLLFPTKTICRVKKNF